MVSSKDGFKTFESFDFDISGSSFNRSCDWSSIAVIGFDETFGELGLLDFDIRNTFGLTRTFFRTESMTRFASEFEVSFNSHLRITVSSPKLRSITEALIK